MCKQPALKQECAISWYSSMVEGETCFTKAIGAGGLEIAEELYYVPRLLLFPPDRPLKMKAY